MKNGLITRLSTVNLHPRYDNISLLLANELLSDCGIFNIKSG